MTTVNLTTPDLSTTRMQKDWRDGGDGGGTDRALFLLCCLLSVLLHVLALIVLPLWIPSASLERPPAPTISYQQTAPNPVQQPMPRQVVTIPPPREQQRPARADLLAEWDAATKDPRKKVGRSFASPLEKSRDAINRVSTNKDKGGKSKAPQGLFPSWRELRSGENGSPDDLPDIPPGDFVQLNTVQWRHAAFFNRMKESVAAAWHPQRRLSRHNPDGLGVRGRRHRTGILVTIDRVGNLLRAELTHSSGFAYLDEEALTAFQRSQPFPRPPQALFGQHGRFSFHAVLVVHVRSGGF